MKVAQVLIIGALMATSANMRAMAAGLDRAPGYMPLLSDVQPDLPIEVRAEAALQAILPQLKEAQARGQIEQYELSRATGVLKMIYRPSAGKPELGGRPVFADMSRAAATVRVPTGRTLAAGVSPDAGGQILTQFNLLLYDNWVSGQAFPASVEVKGEMRNAAGTLVGVFDATTNGSGQLSGPFTWNGYYSDFIPGYTVTFRQGLSLFTSKVPNVRFTSINKAQSKVKGKGPKNKPYSVSWYHRNLDAGNTSIYLVRSGTTSSTGAWGKDFGSTPFRSGDGLNAYLWSNGSFEWRRSLEVPSYMYCNMTGGDCNLYGWPFTPVSIGIIHAGVTYTFSGICDAWGSFSAGLRSTTGTPIALKAGDPVSGTGVAGYLLPKLTGSADAATDVVSGKAPKKKYLDVYVYDYVAPGLYYRYGHANSLGNYSVDYTGSIDILSGNVYYLQASSVNKPTGNTTAIGKGLAPH
jgi:hypothetical protein